MGELPCRLDANDVTRVESLWRRIYDRLRPARWTGGTESRLDIALRRFNKTYEEPGWVENLVDLTVALEALFGPKEPQELTHRLRLRVAFLLGRSDEEAASLYEHVNALYSIRSYIVHGRTLDDKDLEKNLSKLVGKKADPLRGWWDLAPEAVRRARMIVRRGLLGALECFGQPRTEPTWPLPDDFDTQVASPTGKQRWQTAFEVPLQEWLPHFVEPPDDPWYP
jgi:hypothetical protein